MLEVLIVILLLKHVMMENILLYGRKLKMNIVEIFEYLLSNVWVVHEYNRNAGSVIYEAQKAWLRG